MFLQRKGLTDKEIQEACERAGAYVLHESQNRNSLQPQLPNIPMPYSSQVMKYTLFERVKEIIHNTALFSAVIYAVYIFYKVHVFSLCRKCLNLISFLFRNLFDHFYLEETKRKV